MHAGIHRQMHPDRHAPGGKGPAVVRIRHRGAQIPAPQQRGLGGVGPAQDQNFPSDARLAQLDTFRQTGHRKEADALPLQGPGHRHGPMAVSVRLDHRHKSTGRRQVFPQQGGILAQGGQVDLPPGTGIRRKFLPAGGDGLHQIGQGHAERHHRREMDGGVFHQQLPQAQEPGRRPHQYNAPGMKDVHQGGRAAHRPVLPGVDRQQQAEQPPHCQGQKEIHTVVAGDVGRVQSKAFCRHGTQRSHRQAGTLPGTGHRAGGKSCPQQQK